jgi:hypothetical protein
MVWMISYRFLKTYKFDIPINLIVITSNRVGVTTTMTDMNLLHSTALKLRKDMDSYQRTHKIVRECKLNSLIFLKKMRKIVKDMGEDPNKITLQACACYGKIGENTLYDKEKELVKIDDIKLIKSHMVVNIGENFIDPSTEVNSLEDPIYAHPMAMEGDKIYLQAIAANPTYNRYQHAEEFRRFKEFESEANAYPYKMKPNQYEKEMNNFLDSLN